MSRVLPDLHTRPFLSDLPSKHYLPGGYLMETCRATKEEDLPIERQASTYRPGYHSPKADAAPALYGQLSSFRPPASTLRGPNLLKSASGMGGTTGGTPLRPIS